MSDHNQVHMTEMKYDKDRPAAANPLKVMDLTLRDGHLTLPNGMGLEYPNAAG